MLNVKNLHAGISGKEILKGVDLSISPGEIHAVMGRNGSGKSTLSNVITGKDGYVISKGDIEYKDESIVKWSPEKRALAGIFMSFQYPVVMPGVNNTYFLKAALNSKLKNNGKKELNAAEFLKLVKEKLNDLDMDSSYLQRAVNEGFSGGEKKRNEILQMLTLEPELAIMDETDSGLDIDALKVIANGINKYRNPNRSFLVITHYQRLLRYIEPDYVHVLIDGNFVRSGGKELALELEEKGYEWLEE
ncbi:MAG: Fe-S cluster assembly ATPase SufC [Candidatus Neomarinimicrobiota bacterium]